MAKRRRRRSPTPSLAALRRQVQAAMRRLQLAGRRHLAALDRELGKLNVERQALLDEISGTLTGGSARGRGGASRGGRRRRARVDWTRVFSQLPKGTFRAADLRKLAPGLAAGTLSQRLTAWVKARKLKRTGARRGTDYIRLR